MKHRTIAKAVIVVCLAAAAGGCASPYVTHEPLKYEPKPVSTSLRPQVLGEAIDEAQSLQSRYHAKVIELGEGERALGNGLLTLGTLIVGLAAGNVHSSAIEGATLGAGAVYTAGRFNNDPRRAAIYIAGMKALHCAVSAVTPLLLDEQLDDALRLGLDRIDTQIQNTALASGVAEGWLTRIRLAASVRFNPAEQPLVEAIAAAQAAIVRADEASDLARQRRSKPHALARDLNNAVRAVDRHVLDEVRGTQNAMQAIPGILAGLQGNAALFSRQTLWPMAAAAAGATVNKDGVSPKSAIAATGEKPEDAQKRADADFATEVSNALGQLRAETVRLRSQAERLASAAFFASPAQQVSAAVRDCQVDATVKPISVTPATVALSAGKAGTYSILVDGGNGNYTAAFLQTPTPGLTALIRPRSRGVVDIVATDQTVGGISYQLIIEDTTQQSQQIVLVTVGGTAANADDVKDPSDTPAVKAVSLLKKAGKLTIPGKGEVKVVDVAAQGENGLTLYYEVTSGNVTDAEVRKAAAAVIGTNLLGDKAEDQIRVLPNRDVAKPKAGLGERAKASESVPAALAGLNPGQIRKLQLRLCMAPDLATGAWSSASVGALLADRARRSAAQAANGGPISKEEVKALLELDDAAAATRCRG